MLPGSLALFPLWCVLVFPAAAATVGHLRCEHRENPLGLDVAKPRLSWVLESETKGERQRAYQVQVSGGSAPWDSGKVNSDQSVGVEYAGPALLPERAYEWRVRVWDVGGNPTAWSAPARFSTGIRQWVGEWIGSDPLVETSPYNTRGLRWVRLIKGKTELRRQFQLPAGRVPRRAVLALFADNECTAFLNDSEVGRAARWEATTRLDVTAALHPGTNSWVLKPVNSDRLPAAVIGRLVVQFEQGEDWQLPIDGSWSNGEAFDGTPWGTSANNDQPRVPAPYLRKEFSLSKPVKRATAYATALGLYELHLNGQRVSRDVFTPGWTDYRKRVEYQTYDVTPMVHTGTNAVGAILGDGWYAGCLAFTGKRGYYGPNPRFLAQICIEYADGTRQTVATDGSWKAAFGPIRHADLFLGCEYDARLAMPGWDTAGFNEAAWQAVATGLSGKARSVAITERLATFIKNERLALSVENDALGGDPAVNIPKSLQVDYQADGKLFSKSFPEHASVDISGPGLKIVQARYGSLSASAAPRVQAAVADASRPQEELPAHAMTEPVPGVYIFDLGQNLVGWPRLKLRGAAGQRVTVRYGERLNPDGTLYTANLRGATATDFFILSGQGEETLEPYFTFHGFQYVELRGVAKPDPASLTGIVAHSALERTGQFECSNPLLNQLYHNIIWGQKGNYLEVPTDCPQRDERAGWTGDAQFFIPTASYNYNVAPFFTRWLETLCEDSQASDGSMAHVVPDAGLGGGATAWGDAGIICTYNIFRTYNDTRVVAAHFPAMERLLAWYTAKSVEGVPNIGGFGDWLNLGGSASREVIDTAYYAYLSGLMAEMATAIGNREAAARYCRLHDSIKAVFARFFDPDGTLRGCSQTGYALAFSMDLVPAGLRQKTAGKFADEIQRFNDHLATGFIGTPRLLPALRLAGRDDLATRLLLQESYPSWLFQVKLGATTMWERWDGWTPDHGFQDKNMNSFNHYAFGAVGEYLYNAIGGIRAASPGYKKIVIAPFIEGLTWARASYDSVYGRIATSWKVEGNRLDLEVIIPPNTTAIIQVPGKDGGPREVAAGKYTFTSTIQ